MVRGKRRVLASAAVVLVLVVAVAAAIVGAANTLAGADRDPPAWLGAAAFVVGAVLLVVTVFALVHIARRHTLKDPEGVGLFVGVLVVPGGAVAYFLLGPERAEAYVRRVLRAATG